ncbi:MAG TPA: hypothetical protein DCS93_37405 [Microscillaceae bacterium]|nr:hypothetical protein [Microscillaceae bacterium]
MKNYTTTFVCILAFLLTSFASQGQINLDSVRIVDRQPPPSWKIGTQFQAGLQTIGAQQLNQELTTRDYGAFNPIDIHFGLHFLLMYRKHIFGLGGNGYRAHNGDNFYISQFNLGMNYQYTFWKKKSVELLIHGAAYISVLQLRGIRPDPQFFPYSFITSFPVSSQIGIGIDKCTGFKGIFGRSPRLDVRVGARLGYSLPWQNQWYESFNSNQPIDGVPLVNNNGFFYLKFVLTSLVPLGR